MESVLGHRRKHLRHDQAITRCRRFRPRRMMQSSGEAVATPAAAVAPFEFSSGARKRASSKHGRPGRHNPGATEETGMTGSSVIDMGVPSSRLEDRGELRLSEPHFSFASGSCLPAPIQRYSCRRGSNRGSNLGKPAPAGAEQIPTVNSCHRAPGAAFPIPIGGRRRRRRTPRARSPAAAAAGICVLSDRPLTRDATERVHDTHQPFAWHCANRGGERAARLSLSRRRATGRCRTCRGGSGVGLGPLQ